MNRCLRYPVSQVMKAYDEVYHGQFHNSATRVHIGAIFRHTKQKKTISQTKKAYLLNKNDASPKQNFHWHACTRVSSSLVT